MLPGPFLRVISQVNHQEKTMTSAPKDKSLDLPPEIYAEVSIKSRGKVSLFDSTDPITPQTVEDYWAEDERFGDACKRLQDAGFEFIGEPSPEQATLSIKGSPQALERICGDMGNWVPIEVPYPIAGEDTKDITHLQYDLENNRYRRYLGLIDGQATTLGADIEALEIAVPLQLCAATAMPPKISDGSFFLTLPDDVSRLLEADKAHAQQITGKGIRVAMIDTGCDVTHPHFASLSSPQQIQATSPDSFDDQNGHGTAMAANLFALAPGATLLPIKIQEVGKLLTPSEFKREFCIGLEPALRQALALKPNIITASLAMDLARMGQIFVAGGSNEKYIRLSRVIHTILAEIWRKSSPAQHTVVLFSAGNSTVHGFPAQSHFVIAVGGVHADRTGNLAASDLASGFVSDTGRIVPDVCGLCGLKQDAYIMSPVTPDSRQDILDGGSDTAMQQDGWARFSGTSAATAQIAGVAALLLQVAPSLTAEHLRCILQTTARDVSTGQSADNKRAAVGPDLATGSGLVDAEWAIEMAKAYQVKHAS